MAAREEKALSLLIRTCRDRGQDTNGKQFFTLAVTGDGKDFEVNFWPHSCSVVGTDLGICQFVGRAGRARLRRSSDGQFWCCEEFTPLAIMEQQRAAVSPQVLRDMSDLEVCAKLLDVLKHSNGTWVHESMLGGPMSGRMRREISDDELRRAAEALKARCERDGSSIPYLLHIQHRPHQGGERLCYRLVRKEKEAVANGQMSLLGGI